MPENETLHGFEYQHDALLENSGAINAEMDR